MVLGCVSIEKFEENRGVNKVSSQIIAWMVNIDRRFLKGFKRRRRFDGRCDYRYFRRASLKRKLEASGRAKSNRQRAVANNEFRESEFLREVKHY